MRSSKKLRLKVAAAGKHVTPVSAVFLVQKQRGIPKERNAPNAIEAVKGK